MKGHGIATGIRSGIGGGLQIAWLILAITVLVMYVMAVPIFMDQISRQVGPVNQRFDIPLTDEQVRAVSDIGLTRFIYGGWIAGIGLVVGMTYWLVALLLFGSIRSNWVIAVVTLMMIAYIATEIAILESLKQMPGVWGQLAWIIIEAIQAIGEVLSLVVFYIFPDGRFRPRWTRFAAIAYSIFVLGCFFVPSLPLNVLNGDVFDQTPLLSSLHAFAWHATGVAALIYKYKWSLDRETVARTKWFALGLLFAFIVSSLRYLIPAFVQDGEWLQSPAAQVVYKMLLRPIHWLLLLVVPISLGITQILSNTLDARRRAEELQSERERLVAQREEVLHKISNDLHDDLLPDLNLEVFRLDRAISHHQANDSAQTLASMQEVKSQLQDVMMRLRQLTHEWRPPLLDQLGLIEALRAEAISAFGTHDGTEPGLVVSVVAPDEPVLLPPAIETTAYRITREALKNVVTHAHAKSCVIRLTIDRKTQTRASSVSPKSIIGGQTLHIQIEDDGIGFKVQPTFGKGLASMRHRAEEIGGIFTCHSRQGHGTVISIVLPLLPNVLNNAIDRGPDEKDTSVDC